MKLNLKIHTTKPRVEKVKLNSEIVELFDAYVKYYQKEMGANVTSEKAIIEMLSAFMKSDRNFMRWYREKPGDQIQ